MTVTLLEWDTAFFGVRIGQATIDDAEDIAEVEAATRELDLACLYLRLPQPADPMLAVQLQQAGYRLTDVSNVLAAPLGVSEGDASIPVPASAVQSGSLNGVLDALVPWSRFAADPRFGPGAARAMYVAWVERAAEADDELLMVTHATSGGVDGLITASRSPTPRIGLLVSTGRGQGAHLVAAAKRWAAERGDRLETVTQARNAAALRFYERHGFRTTSSTYVFHRWLTDENPRHLASGAS